MFIGLAFNERNDAFDFNTALEDSKREKEMEKKAVEGGGRGDYVKSVDYKMKEGEKIRVSIPKVNSGDDGSSPTAAGVVGAAARRREAKRAGSGKGGGFWSLYMNTTKKQSTTCLFVYYLNLSLLSCCNALRLFEASFVLVISTRFDLSIC